MHENFICLLSNENNSLDGLIFELKNFPLKTQTQEFSVFLKLKMINLVCSHFITYTW